MSTSPIKPLYTEAELPCSRYCIGHVDGDGISVWLNDDMQEVNV